MFSINFTLNLVRISLFLNGVFFIFFAIITLTKQSDIFGSQILGNSPETKFIYKYLALTLLLLGGTNTYSCLFFEQNQRENLLILNSLFYLIPVTPYFNNDHQVNSLIKPKHLVKIRLGQIAVGSIYIFFSIKSKNYNQVDFQPDLIYLLLFYYLTILPLNLMFLLSHPCNNLNLQNHSLDQKFYRLIPN